MAELTLTDHDVIAVIRMTFSGDQALLHGLVSLLETFPGVSDVKVTYG